ncbi:hypothetical protein F511_34302, partial [Dorcoceras hygrometricum]
LMVAISAGLKMNWAYVLFQILVSMVHTPNRQSQGFVVQMSVMLEKLVKANLGESVKLHSLKVLNHKSVRTYMKKNLTVGPSGESSKKIGEIANAADSLQSLTNKQDKKVEKKKKKEKEPGSDQFQEGIGTSMVERLDRRLIRYTTRISTPLPVCTRKTKKILGMESPRRDGITDSACKNQSVMVSVQYGPFNSNIPIRSTTIDGAGVSIAAESGDHQARRNVNRCQAQAGLPIVFPERSVDCDTSNEITPGVSWSEWKAQHVQQLTIWVEEIDRTVENVDETKAVNFQENQALEKEQKDPEYERQAQTEEQPAPEDGQQALEQPAPEEEDQPQPDPTQSSTTHFRFSFSSNSVNNEDRHDPDPSSLSIVKYMGKQTDKQITPEEAQRVQQLTNLPTPTPVMDNTAKELTSLKDIVSSLDSKIDRIGVDTYFAKHTALKFRQQLDTKIDGLETSLVHQFTDRQQNLAGDIVLLKSQVSEMVECLKQIRDAKKGEGTSKKRRPL